MVLPILEWVYVCVQRHHSVGIHESKKFDELSYSQN